MFLQSSMFRCIYLKTCHASSMNFLAIKISTMIILLLSVSHFFLSHTIDSVNIAPVTYRAFTEGGSIHVSCDNFSSHISPAYLRTSPRIIGNSRTFKLCVFGDCGRSIKDMGNLKIFPKRGDSADYEDLNR